MKSPLRIAFALFACLLAGTAGCGGGGTSCEDGPLIVVSTTPSNGQAVANGIDTVQVIVSGKDDICTPFAAGTSFRFTIANQQPAGVGYFRKDGGTSITETTVTLTGVSVQAEVKSEVEGTAEVTVFTPDYNLTATPVEVTFIASQCNATVVATPTLLPGDGASLSSLTATLTAADGSPAPDGTTVTFTTTSGTFLESGNRSHQTQSLAGQATATLQSATVTQATTAQVTAGFLCSGIVTSDTVDVQFFPPQCRIELAADPTTIVGDGLSTSTLTATLTADTGTPMPDGTTVDFTTDLGTFSGSGNQSYQSLSTDGVATATLVSEEVSQNQAAQVTAAFTCTDSQSYDQTVSVNFIALDAPQIILSASSDKVYADDASTLDITAEVFLADGSRAGAGETVSFSTDLSRFEESGTSTYDALTDDSGIARVTLIGGTIAGNALIQAITTIQSQTAQDQLTIKIYTVGSIIFVSADPTKLGVKGSGRVEISDIVFQVLDSNDEPFPAGLEVEFTHSSAPTVSLEPSTTLTDDNGMVGTKLHAGTVSTTVTVTATHWIDRPAGLRVTATSPSIAIVGAKPNATHMTFWCERLNVGGLVVDDEETECTIRLADRYSNAIGFATVVHFRTEAGTIIGDAITSESGGDMGTATTTIFTGNPRPVDVAPLPLEPFINNNNPRDGLVTILAMTSGEEDFTDGNGNGLFDYVDENSNGVQDPGEPSEPFIDLGEPFVDNDDDGIHDASEDQFLDANGNFAYDGPNGVWDGNTMIWIQTFMVWTFRMEEGTCSDAYSSLCPAVTSIPFEGMELFTYTVRDANLNPLNGTCRISASVDGKGRIEGELPPLPWNVLDSLGISIERILVSDRVSKTPCTDQDRICYYIPIVSDFSSGFQGTFIVSNTNTDTAAESGTVNLQVSYRESPGVGQSLVETIPSLVTFEGDPGR